MSKVIIYKRDNGILAVVIPTADALATLGIEAIALKDVPTGKPFNIVDEAFLPPTRNERDAWTIDNIELTDGVGK